MTTDDAVTTGPEPPAGFVVTGKRPGGGRVGGWRRWWRRRPVRRALVVSHRWSSLALGLVLVVQTTTGAIALYHGEWFRSTHAWFYRHTASAQPVDAQRAFDLVAAAHPDFGASWVSRDNGIYAVGNPSYTTAYAVDPGTGRINGRAGLDDGVMGWIVNLHDCALTCPGYTGYVPFLAATAVAGLSWGEVILAGLGFLLILLAVTGLITWWPGFRRLSRGFRVRLRKGRFARDYDLHNLVGILAVPALLMWGVTGAAFEVPAVENAWLALTGGHAVDPDRYSFTAEPAAANATRLSLDQAADIAVAHTGGRVVYVTTPSGPGSAAYYGISLASAGYAPEQYRAFYGGDLFVYVDSHDPGHVSVVDSDEPGANAFYDRVFEPAHFGWMVNGWWRLVWFGFGLTPLALAVTGVSTWLYRASTRRRRAARAAA